MGCCSPGSRSRRRLVCSCRAGLYLDDALVWWVLCTACSHPCALQLQAAATTKVYLMPHLRRNFQLHMAGSPISSQAVAGPVHCFTFPECLPPSGISRKPVLQHQVLLWLQFCWPSMRVVIVAGDRYTTPVGLTQPLLSLFLLVQACLLYGAFERGPRCSYQSCGRSACCWGTCLLQ